MVVFSIGLIGGDWLWGGRGRAQEMLALRLVMCAGAVIIWWIIERMRSRRT